MIKIDIKKKGDYINEIRLTGHGGGIKGKDIVCAAVSAVTQTALSGLLHFGKKNISWKIGNGYLFIKVKDDTNHENLQIFHIILSTMIIGLESIKKEYPRRILLNIDEGKDNSSPINQ